MAEIAAVVRKRSPFALLRLVLIAVLAWWPVVAPAEVTVVPLASGSAAPSAAAQARPPMKDLYFFIFNPSGKDVGKDLNAVAALHSKRGGRFFVGKANGAVLDQVVKKGYAPTHLSSPERFDTPAGTGGGVEALATDPDPDTDGDGLTDVEEARYNTDPNNPDTDQDFLSDGDEVHVHGTWPLKESTDGDRYDDGQEVLGYSPAGLGALGGDMPGYVLAPGDQPLVAAYPKIDFEIRDGVEMQPREQVTIGTKTITTETKSKETMQRSLDIVTVGKESNYINGNQGADSDIVLREHQAQIDNGTPSSVAPINASSRDLAVQVISTAHSTEVDQATAPASETNIARPSDAVRSETLLLSANGPYDASTYQADPLLATFYDLEPEFNGQPTSALNYANFREAEEERLATVREWVGIIPAIAGAATGNAWIVPVGKILMAAAAQNYAAQIASGNVVLHAINEKPRWLQFYLDKYLSCRGETADIPFTVYRSNCAAYVYNNVGVPRGLAAAARACRQEEGTLPATRRTRGEPLLPRWRLVPTGVNANKRWSDFLLWMAETGGACNPGARSSLANTTTDTGSKDLTTTGPFDVGGHLATATSDFGSGMVLRVDDSGTASRSRIFDEPQAEGETSKKLPISRTSLRETIVTEKYSWSVTKEDWQSVTTDSTDFGTVTFSFDVRNTGTDIAKDAAGLRFNLYVGDNPATPEVEVFNPVTFPSIQDPAITFQNVGPGDEMLFGATLHLAKQQFRALDEGAAMKIAVADYSYGADELYYRSAAGSGVRFLIDNGVMAAAASRYQEFLIPVAKVWDESFAALREPTYGELLAKAVPVVHQDGILQSINGRPIGSSAWWSMMLTKPTDASLFYRSTAVKGQTVRLEYHGDADADGYADAVELEKGTDPDDATAHPSPVIIGALHESPDPDNPGWTIGRFKVTNAGTYEAYGMEARIYATDADVEITDALVGGSGLVRPGETFDHPDDVFRYRSTSGRKPLLEIRYNDPTGLKILLSTAAIPSLTDDISGLAAQMRSKGRITAEAPETFFYDVPQRLTVGYANPTTTTIRNAVIAVDWQSLMGDILKHENRSVDLRPGSSFASFEFRPQDHLSPVNIGGRFKALVRVMDHNGALIDSKVSYMILFPRQSEVEGDGSPRLALAGSPWAVGTVTRGAEVRETLVISNIGASPLEVALSATSTALRFEGPSLLTVSPGAQARVLLILDTASLPIGSFSALIQIGSNEPTNPIVTVPVTATISEPTSVVTLFPVEGRPWDRRVFINGSFPAGTTLYFDHDIPGEQESVLPLRLFDATRSVELGHSAEAEPLSATLARTGSSATQCQLTLPEDTVGGRTYLLQFGKRADHDFLGSGVLSVTASIPHGEKSQAVISVWKHHRPDYDEFSDGALDTIRWTVSPPGSGMRIDEVDGVLRFGAEMWKSAVGQWTAKATLDAKASRIDTIEFRVRGGWRIPESSSSPAFWFAVGGVRVLNEGYAGPGTIDPFTVRLDFDRLSKTVHVRRDGESVGTVDLSSEVVWTFGFGFSRTSYAASCMIDVDWIRVSRIVPSFSVHFGSEELWAWALEDAGLIGQGDIEAQTHHQSPNVATVLNGALAGLPASGGLAQLPISTRVNYQGWTVLTDLALEERAGPESNLRAASLTTTSPVVADRTTELRLLARNTTATAVGPFTCAFYLMENGQRSRLLASASISTGLAPGAEALCVGLFTPSALSGDVTIVGVLDPEQVVQETDESDNEAMTSLRVVEGAYLSIDCGAASLVPNAPAHGQGAVITLSVSNRGGVDALGAILELFDGGPDIGGLVIARVVLSVGGAEKTSVSIPWVPAYTGSHAIFARILYRGGSGSELRSETCLILEVTVPRSSAGGFSVDCGDEASLGSSDGPYPTESGYGHLDGSAEVTWGTLPWQSYRYGFGGVVRYRFDNLSPEATYHLDATFYEGDGVGRTAEVWVDGVDTGKAVSLAGGQIHRLSVTLPKTAYSSDGSVVVEFRRRGPGDVLVNALSLRQVESWYVDSGDGGVTDVAFTAERGYGFLNGSTSTAWGTSAAQSIRYGLTGDVKYRFTNLDPTRRYRVSATLLEGDGQGRVEQLEVDGFAIGAPVALSGTLQVASGLVPAAAYASDRSVDVRIARTNGSQAVVSEVRLEEETLPVRTLSDSSVTPAAGDGATAFTWEVTFTDLDGALPDAVTVTVDGTPHPMAATDPAVTDTRRGRRYAYSATGLSDGLHTYSFSATVAGEAATGDVLAHVGPLVGGPGLPDTGAWGLIPGGDATHPSEVLYAFGPVSKPVRLGYEVYDVDSEGEVEVFLNGTSLGFVPATTDAQWSGARELILPLSALRSSGGNQLAFRSTVNQPSGSEPWGVRNVSLLAERPEGFAVEDVPGDDGNALLVRWVPSVDDGAALDNVLGYRVYRATAPQGPYTLVHTAAPGTALWVDAGVTCETRYWYQVAAFNGLQDSSTPLMVDAAPLDNRPPAVLGASPAAGAMSVPSGTPVVLHVVDTGRGVDETSIDVRVNGAYVNPALSGAPGDLTATIVPPATAPGTPVTVTLSAADLATPPNRLEGWSLSFTTGQDATPPYLFAPSPGAGATGVDPNVVISVQVRDDGSGVDASSVVLQVNGIQVSPVASAAGGAVTLSFDPPSAFSAGQVVTVAVSARDLAPVPNLLSGSWSFTVATGGEGPVITSATPASAPVVLLGATVPFVVTTQDDTLDLTTVTWRVDGSVAKTGTTFNGSGGGDWMAFRPITLSGGATAYTDEWVSLALGAHSTTPSDYLVHDDFASLDPAWAGFNTTPAASGGTLNVTTSSTDLSGSVDTYPFVYRSISPSGDWTAEVQATCTNNATSDGCGLLVKADADNWYFVGQAWDAGLNADAVTFRFQTGGMSMVNLPVAQAAGTVLLRVVKTGNLLYASWRPNTSSAWTALGAAPIFATNLQVGMAAWETTTTALTANFDTFRCATGTTLPVSTLLTGAKAGFADIRVTEQNGAVQSLVPIRLTDANFDGLNDTVTFPADATAAGAWKTYRVYYGNPSATNLSTTTLPGSNAFAEPAPVLGAATAIIGSSFGWTASPTGSRTIEAQASDGTSSDYRSWTVTVLPATPPAPTGLTATPDDGKVHLSWAASAAANVAGYHVYRDGAKVTVSPVATAAYTDTGLANGVSRCWTVRAVSPGAVESPDSNQVCVAPRDRVAPAAPVGLAVEPGNASAQLSWYPGWSPDLAGYKVYRKLHTATTFTLATASPVASPAFLDQPLVNGTAYDWAVTSLDTSGNESGLSAVVTASPRVPPPVEVSIGDAVVLEGNTGTREAVFSVTLSRAPGAAVSLSWATAAGTAAAGTDFQPSSGGLTFGAAETLKTITVLVNGDEVAEESETFFVNLSGVTGATTFDGQGMGTILNDDVQVPAGERSALIALYDATNGGGWTARTNWRNAAGTDFNDPGTECAWLGVTCDASGTHVVALELPSNHLVGTIPATLGNLAALQALSLRSNQLSGPIPASLGALAALRTLDLGSNGGLTGPIPVSLGGLARLEQLVLRGNQLDGEIPAALGGLLALKVLDLSANRLTGALPPALGQLVNLEQLDLGFNLFAAGPVPEWLQGLTNLTHLGLSTASRTGPLPSWIGTLGELRVLAVDGNSLDSALPSALGSLANLEQLQIGGNAFTGSVPGTFVNLTNLAGSASELRWNALQTSDGALRAFLNSKQRQGGNWEGTQTVAPANLGVLSTTESSVSLAWSPIAYATDPGGYEVHVATQPGGPYSLVGTTLDKTTAAGSVTGLLPGRTYYFVVRSKTDPHTFNLNTVRSLPSAEVTATTAACVPPATPSISAPAAVTAGATFTASVATHAGSTWAWGVTNGTIDSGQGSNQVTVTASSESPVTLTVVETNGVGCASAEASLSIPVGPSGATAFHTLAPCRALDTRNVTGDDAAAPVLDPDDVRTFDLTGRCALPATARALSVNVTVVVPASGGDLVAYRGDLETPPVTSSISFAAGKTRANNGLLELSRDGALTIKVHNRATSPVHFILDVNGYFE